MMLTYDYFARTRGWTPSQVNELTLDELYWFPLIEEARNAAIEQLRDKD
jgi:hypothetical protein